MITTQIVTSVKCGSKGTLARLWKITEAEGAEQIQPLKFACSRCKQKWNMEDFSGGAELDTVTCSNCYSSNVRIVRVKITYLTAKDFEVRS